MEFCMISFNFFFFTSHDTVWSLNEYYTLSRECETNGAKTNWMNAHFFFVPYHASHFLLSLFCTPPAQKCIASLLCHNRFCFGVFVLLIEVSYFVINMMKRTTETRIFVSWFSSPRIFGCLSFKLSQSALKASTKPPLSHSVLLSQTLQ